MPINKEFLIEAFQKKYELNIFVEDVVRRVFGQEVEIYSTPEKHELKTEQEKKIIEKTIKYGHLELADESGSKLFATDKLDFYEVILKPSVRLEQNRVTIQQFVRSLLVPGHAALINFVSPHKNDKWRLSLVSKDSELTEKGIQEYSTHAKRFTFLIEKNRLNSTAAIRLSELSKATAFTIKNITQAFSVETLSKAFFDEYKYHYEEKFLPYFIKNKNLFKQPDNVDKEKLIRDFTKKMLGRIVFLYFVQKKGWLGASSIEYKDGDENFILNLFKSSKAGDSFYQTWLRKLFFETLNENQTPKRKKEEFDLPNGTTVHVPYLNGGLFDSEEIDKNIITVKAKLFHIDDIKVSETPNERGFLDFLNSFNFTIYEDDPEAQTIAVDPEMLGHIFENLLEDNKDKGTFYTPKEIVHYMCQESLIEYLATKLNANDQKRKDLELLIKNPSLCRELNKFRYESDYVPVMEALKNVKICDPAIGSGAFPMGMLLEIYRLVEQFSFERDAIAVWKINDWEKEKHKVKLSIIQNSIYGVDIEKGAVDIARLRFWLSLIVDLEMPEALPNLDYKIVEGNSLVSELHISSKNKLFVDIDWSVASKIGTDSTKKYFEKIAQGLIQLDDLQHKYFTAQGDKKKLQKEIRLLKIEILIAQIELDKIIFEINSREQGELFSESKADKNKELEIKLKLETYKEAIKHLKEIKADSSKPLRFFNFELDFAEVTNININKDRGFDIVIGNPPYVSNKELGNKFELEKKYKTAKGQYDLFSLFIELSFSLLKANGIHSFIIPDSYVGRSNFALSREYFFKNSSCNRLLHINKVFDSANVSSLIYFTRATNKIDPENKITYVKSDSVTDWMNNNFSEISFLQSKILKTNNNRILHLQDEEYNLVQKLLSTPYIIDAACTLWRGEEIGKKSDFIIENNVKGSLKILSGTNVQRFYIKEPVRYIKKTNVYKELKNYEKEKAVVRQLGENINATFDLEGMISTQSVYNIISDQVSVKALTGILNSSLVDFIYQKYFKEKQEFPRILLENLKELPLPLVKEKSLNQLDKLVTKISDLKIKNKDTSSFENEIDFIVFKLYNLSYDEAVTVSPTFKTKVDKTEYKNQNFNIEFLTPTELNKLLNKKAQKGNNTPSLKDIEGWD